MKLFGFDITLSKQQREEDLALHTITPSVLPDGAAVVEVGDNTADISIAGHYGDIYGQSVSFDVDTLAISEQQLIQKYREIAMVPEVEFAIDDIINEMITTDENVVVEVDLDNLPYTESLKQKIRVEFEHIVNLLDFNNSAFEVVKRWYIDGRLTYQVVVNANTAVDTGISKLSYIDPRQIKKVNVVRKSKDQRTGVDTYQQLNTHYIFSENGFGSQVNISNQSQAGAQLSNDSIVQITSGLLNPNNTMVLSFLHKALRPLNQLKSLEDSTIIYKLSRAPERRVFYIDVGNLPPAKAEEVLKKQAERYRSKMVYDVTTGTVRSDPRMMVMTEDFFLPRRSDGKATEITTLPGGQNLGEMAEVQYFLNKLYKSLNVPISRLDPQAGFNFGRVTEINRDEVKFMHFVGRLRKKFSDLFIQLLRRQLALKNIMSVEEFDKISNKLSFEYNSDNIFEDAKFNEIMGGRLDLLQKIDAYKGEYFPKEWIQRNILKLSMEEIKLMDAQVNKEVGAGLYTLQDDNADRGGAEAVAR